MPVWSRYRLNMERLQSLRRIERARGVRLITMIHRQEMISLLGFPISRYINIEDSEEVLRAIRQTPDDRPIEMLLHTPGGLVLAAEQIAQALQRHPAKVTVYVPHYAMSGGTLISLAADEICMDENAVLGPVDPQLGKYPAISILRAVELKGHYKVDDETLILADVAGKAIEQVRNTVFKLIKPRLGEEEGDRIARLLTFGKWTHDYPIDVDQLKEMGLPVRTGIPDEYYRLMDLYPQPASRRPSVQYVPMEGIFRDR